MTSVVSDSKTRFCPTEEQIEYAREYLAESGLGSLIVAVNFSDKDQICKPVMDGGAPAIWLDRDSALFALDNGFAGSALFRVYSDGHVHLVDEK